MSGDIKAAHRELTETVMGQPGVTGTAIGMHGGRPCLIVYLDGREAGESVPSSVGGFPVRAEISGRFKKL